MIIGFEGLPGAGKTTIIEQLPFPYVQEMLVSSDEEATFSEQDYAEHDARKVALAQSLSEKGVCLMDRTDLSYHAYAHALQNTTDEPSPVPQPDTMHLIYLDIPARVSAQRRLERQWEPGVEFAERVARFYEAQIRHMGAQATRIDAARPFDEVFDDVQSTINRLTH